MVNNHSGIRDAREEHLALVRRRELVSQGFRSELEYEMSLLKILIDSLPLENKRLQEYLRLGYIITFTDEVEVVGSYKPSSNNPDNDPGECDITRSIKRERKYFLTNADREDIARTIALNEGERARLTKRYSEMEEENRKTPKWKNIAEF